MKHTSGIARPFLTLLERSVAGLLAASFVVTALPAIILFNLERSAFNPAVYERALADENFYQQFPSLLGDLIVNNIGRDAPAFLRDMPANVWKALLEGFLPQQDMQAITENALDQFFAYINGETQTPTLSLVPLKRDLAGSSGLKAALTIIRSQPDCTVEQITRMVNGFGQELCHPPEEILAVLQPVIQIQLQAAASAIPDNVAMLGSSDSNFTRFVLGRMNWYRIWMRFSLFIPLVLLIGLTVVYVRTLKDVLVWWGWPFMLTGLFGIPLAFGGASLFRSMIERWLSRYVTLTLPPDFAATIRSIAEASLREILKPAGWESLALLIMGLIMILWSSYSTKREKSRG